MADYSAKLVDHFSNPRNIGEMDNSDAKAFIGNPVCGDQLHIFVRIQGERITECTFLGYGCAASLATGSILTEAVIGRNIDDLLQVTEAEVIGLVGGLTPTQRHCSTLARDVLHSLARNYRGLAPEDTRGSGPVCS